MQSPLKYLRFQAFDVSSEAGRNAERYRLALWSMLANVGSKFFALLLMVLSVSWTLPYLGAERFGVWMTIASLVGMLIFLDLGIGNALVNDVANVAAKNDPAALTQTISGGLGLLLIIGALSALLLAGLVAVLPWAKLIKVQDPLLQHEVRDVLFLFAGLFGVNLFSAGVLRVFAGLQRSFEGHLASAIASIVSIALLWYAASTQQGIAHLLWVTLGCQSVCGIFLLLLLAKRGLWRWHGIGRAIRSRQRQLLQSGGLFFILQVGTMIGWGADSLIISSTLGALQVAAYSVTQRLFQFISVPLAMVNAPLWSAYANADACGDRAFIRRTLKRTLLGTGLAALLVGGSLFLVGQPLISWWTHGAIAVPTELIAVFALWTLCESMGNSLAMMLNGCGIVREQVIAVVFLTVLALPIKIYAVSNFGIAGMIAAYLTLYCASIALFYGVVFKKKISEKLGRP